MNGVPPLTASELADALGDYEAAPMSADRFRDLWHQTGLSLRHLAKALAMRGRHASTHLREMADGVRDVPGPTGIALEALADGWRPRT